MDALLVEIMQLCLLLERKGKPAKLSWHSGSAGVRASMLVEFWPSQQHYRLWLHGCESVEYFSRFFTFGPDNTLQLQDVINRLKEAAK